MTGYQRARLLTAIARILREYDWLGLALLKGEMRKAGYHWSVTCFTSSDSVEASFVVSGQPAFTAIDTDELRAVCYAARLALRVENTLSEQINTASVGHAVWLKRDAGSRSVGT